MARHAAIRRAAALLAFPAPRLLAARRPTCLRMQTRRTARRPQADRLRPSTRTDRRQHVRLADAWTRPTLRPAFPPALLSHPAFQPRAGAGTAPSHPAGRPTRRTTTWLVRTTGPRGVWRLAGRRQGWPLVPPPRCGSGWEWVRRALLSPTLVSPKLAFLLSIVGGVAGGFGAGHRSVIVLGNRNRFGGLRSVVDVAAREEALERVASVWVALLHIGGCDCYGVRWVLRIRILHVRRMHV